MRNGQIIHEESVSFEPTCVGILNDEEIAIGEGGSNGSVRIYGLADNGITEKKTLALSGVCTDLAFSPDGSYLVTSDGNRKVTLFRWLPSCV